MKESKKLGIKHNIEKTWSQFYSIKFEIDISLDAVKKMISIQNNSLWELDEELDKKIKATSRSSAFETEQELDMYVSHLHGIEESIIVEFGKIQVANHISAIFSIFENKLKSLCDKLDKDFQVEPIEKKGSYIPYYWKILQTFLKDNSKPIEKLYTPIYNKYVVRNVMHHQDGIAKKSQYQMFKHLTNIETLESEETYYIYEISPSFCNTLVTEIELFFRILLAAVKEKTTELIAIDECPM